MLTFLRIIGRSLLIAAGAIVGDGLVAYGMALFGLSFVEAVGDLMLVEVAILFLVAGLIDFSSSVGAVQFRKAVLGSKQEYSQSAHKDAERKAAVLVLAGVFMFVVLTVVAVITRS
jgi:hypothetical protein